MTISLGINWSLNFILPCFQYFFIRLDPAFKTWFNARCAHRLSYNVLNVFSFTICFKILWLPFSGFLHVFIFRAILTDNSALTFLRVMNVLSFIGTNLTAVVAGSILAYNLNSINQMFYIYLDMVICNIIAIIFGLVTFKLP